MQLLYAADPLCSWCYGFGPELGRVLAAHPQAKVDLCMGGLRPFNTERVSVAFLEMLRGHWKHVHEASGLAFNDALISRADFTYDTEPACRAVVTARALDAGKALAYLEAVQVAFYRDARDMTRAKELAEVAAETGLDRAAFLALFASDEMKNETRLDFTSTQSLGVSGFPTLGIAFGQQLYLVSSGFAKAEVLLERLDQIERLSAEARAAKVG